MRVTSVCLSHVQVPMLAPFAHAKARRAATDNVVCCVQLSDGPRGFGEGVPRSNVTGETVDDVLAALADLPVGQLVGDFSSWEHIFTAMSRIHDMLHDDGPMLIRNAARCAIEL